MAAAYALMVAGNSHGDTFGADILTDPQVKWEKAPCRFCGTGCGVMVGVKKGKVVAVAGDTKNPVNKGFLCVKGYHLPSILYGKDRLKKPLLRQANGTLSEISWDKALDLVAQKFTEATPQNLALYGSGQWTVQDGYAAIKFMKGGLGTNNLECNARLCMASAVAGFTTTFGKDEPMGCYDDFELTDYFILWGNNMAEMHPVLFSRLADHRRKNPHVKIIDIATRKTRTSENADLYLEIQPQADLALANAICRELIHRNQVDQKFIKAHVLFKKGTVDIGYGLEDEKAPLVSDELIGFDEFKRLLEPYTLTYTEKLTGISSENIRLLADIYGNPAKKVVSLWCMGVNQHTRGTWMNNLIYNLHLLTGKISSPGNSPFSLTGQPSACGTAREVGTLTQGLPGGRTVENPEDRDYTEKAWKIKPGTIPAQPSMHTMAMFRHLKNGVLKAMWIQATNPMVTLPDLDKFISGIKKHRPFIVVSDIYPTPTTDIADLILPSALWIEREGCFGNSERRTQQWNKMVEPPGEARPDCWQLIEVAKRMGHGHLFPWKSDEEQALGLYEEYRTFTIGTGKDVAAYGDLKSARGIRWPVVNGQETRWRYREGEDPYVKKGEGVSFYGNKKYQHKAIIWFRPYAAPPESPDKEYPFWLCTGRVLEHWHSGSMTRRVKELHQAVPKAYVELNPEDAREMGFHPGQKVKLKTRRGELVLEASINDRSVPQRGMVFVPFFDENHLINKLTLDQFCPLSKEPDYKKCAVKLEKA